MVPGKSVLDPLLFIIYINSIDCGETSDLNKLADKAKKKKEK